MNSAILHDETQQFIQNHLNDDLTKLILKGSPFKDISVQELANQIAAKNKSFAKIPTWFQLKKCYYPNKVSIEQSSSEITAKYKSELVLGENIIDLTGGFGVDCYYFSKRFSKVIHCEIDKDLSEIVTYNFNQLKVENIEFISMDGIEFLKRTEVFFDWIYLDPSRRNDLKEKVFLLEHCSPNVPENLDFLFTKTRQILIKTSPILDIFNTIKTLQFVKEVHIVAFQNEVKELLFVLEKDFNSVINIKTINFTTNNIQKFNFLFQQQQPAKYALPLTYLYEPNAAILKSGGFEEVTTQFEVYKLHKHSHLYTSKSFIDFPGRIFKILSISNYDKKALKKLIPNLKANITTRNFPKTVAQIRKETNLKEGGEVYLFFTTLENDQLAVLLTNKC